jgi:gag-polypeptide of LTR copia-type
MIEKLNERYSSSSFSARMSLMSELNDMSYARNADMSEYVDNYTSLLDRLQTMDAKVPQPLAVIMFLSIRLYEGASFSPDRLHNRPEAARYILTLVTPCSDRNTHTLSKFS